MSTSMTRSSIKKPLSWQTQQKLGRRVGLPKSTFASLHGETYEPKEDNDIAKTMAAHPGSPNGIISAVNSTTPGKFQSGDDDILRSPDSSDDYSDESPTSTRMSTDIENTTFTSKPLPTASSFSRKEPKGGSENSSRFDAATCSSTTRSGPKQRRGPPLHKPSSQSPKRKSQDDTDISEKIVLTKRKKLATTYTTRPAISQQSSTRNVSIVVPRRTFTRTNIELNEHSGSDDSRASVPAEKKFTKADIEIDEHSKAEAITASAPKVLKFQPPDLSNTPYSTNEKFSKKKKVPGSSHLQPVSKSNKPGLGFLQKIEKSQEKPLAALNLPAIEVPKFKKIILDDGDSNMSLDQSSDSGDPKETPMIDLRPKLDDYIPSTKQESRCPMCKQLVDSSILDTFGRMNIRQQEKFCRNHQKASAKEKWREKNYPQIDWVALKWRVSKIYPQIKEWVCGKPSHYRSALEETIKSGKERNLLKLTSNLTPGYYGPRGLNVISEAIMDEFTKLLKKQAVEDKVIMARGVTGFVQSVLVLEVATLLIMEDLDVGEEKAREVLVESSGMGDLVHEEVMDIVTKRDQDSGDD